MKTNAQRLRNALNTFACFVDAQRKGDPLGRQIEAAAKEMSDEDAERLWQYVGEQRKGARYAYTVHVGSHDGPLYWGYSGLEFDTVEDAREHASANWRRDVERGRNTRPQSELYLVVSPVSVHYVSTPGTW